MSSGRPGIQRKFVKAKPKLPPIAVAGGLRWFYAARNVPNKLGKTFPVPLMPEFRWNVRDQRIYLTRIESPKGGAIPIHEKSHILMMNIIG